jgi:hypothetical protein
MADIVVNTGQRSENMLIDAGDPIILPSWNFYSLSRKNFTVVL